MLNNLLRYQKNQKYIFFDYETEGLNLYSSKPFQLSFILAKGSKILEKFDSYIDWPDIHISEEIQNITKVNLSTYNRTKKDATSVLNSFEKYLYDPDYLIVGHNIINYDIFIHNTHRRLLGRDTDYTYIERIVDTNCLAKSMKYNIPKPNNDTMFQWQQRLVGIRKRGVKTNQAAMLTELNIDFDKERLHNSLYDVEKNAEMFFQMLWRVEV